MERYSVMSSDGKIESGGTYVDERDGVVNECDKFPSQKNIR